MSGPGEWIETVQNPVRYLPEQIDRAAWIAWCMRTYRFVLVEPPDRA